MDPRDVVWVFDLSPVYAHTEAYKDAHGEKRSVCWSIFYILNTKYQFFFKWSSQPTKVVSVHYIAVRRATGKLIEYPNPNNYITYFSTAE